MVKCVMNRDGTPEYLNLTVGKIYKTKASNSNSTIYVKDNSGKYIEYSKSIFKEVWDVYQEVKN